MDFCQTWLKIDKKLIFLTKTIYFLLKQYSIYSGRLLISKYKFAIIVKQQEGEIKKIDFNIYKDLMISIHIYSFPTSAVPSVWSLRSLWSVSDKSRCQNLRDYPSYWSHSRSAYDSQLISPSYYIPLPYVLAYCRW